MTATHSNKIHADGIRWLLGAGVAAVCLALFLVFIDRTLSNSTHEQTLGATIGELRRAQHELTSGITDSRATQSFIADQVYDVEPQREVANSHSDYGDGHSDHDGAHAAH